MVLRCPLPGSEPLGLQLLCIRLQITKTKYDAACTHQIQVAYTHTPGDRLKAFFQIPGDRLRATYVVMLIVVVVIVF